MKSESRDHSSIFARVVLFEISVAVIIALICIFSS